MKNKTLVIYIHGKGGNASESDAYRKILPDCDVVGMDYKSKTPQETMQEFPKIFDELSQGKSSVILIANSIGAYFAMLALADKNIKKAFFISPIVDMEKLIKDMMSAANVTEKELQENGEIKTAFGETLSWDYLQYVKKHEIKWKIPSHILYGENDNLTAKETIYNFSKEICAKLTIMPDGEHWFHTDKQTAFLYNWIIENFNK